MKKLTIFLLAACLLICRALAEGNALENQARMDITEVFGYTAEEAASFVFEAQPDGNLRYWPAEHPDWVYTEKYREDGTIGGETPFNTGYVYSAGEGVFRDLLYAMEQRGWLENWNDGARAELISLCMERGAQRLSTTLRFAESAAQAVDGLVETCYGPRARWTAALLSLRDGVLTAHGLTAAEQPFHVSGVRRAVGSDRASRAQVTLLLFEGEAPQELQAALADPHLGGWKLTSGAVRINSWEDQADSGAGLAAFEKEGRRQLIQLALLHGGWRAFPLGEKAMRQAGDYRVTYDEPCGFTVEYLLDAEETLSFYLSPIASENDDYVQAYTEISAGHRVNQRTGDAQWLGVNGSDFTIWMDEWQRPYAEGTTVRFLPFLGLADIADFPLTLEEGQRGCLPENTGMTLGAVNFRAKTSSHSKTYGQLMSGVVVPVLDLLPGDPWPWVHTKLGGYEGYIAQIYVDMGDEELNANAPQPVARASREIALKRGTGLLDGTVTTLPAGTRMHVVMADGSWLYVSVPRGDMTELMDTEGVFGYVKKSDVQLASMLCQLDWME